MMIEVMASCSPAQWGLSCNRLCCAPISAPQRGNPSSPTSNARTNESRRVLESGVRGNPPAPFGRGERPQGPTYPYNVRKYKTGKRHKLLIKPAKKNVAAFLEKVRDIVKANKPLPAGKLIAKLNPIIRGWANYHRHVVSKKTFSTVDEAIYQTLKRWINRRHPHKSDAWKAKKYFKTCGGDNWVFFGKEGEQTWHLTRADSVPITRHVKIRGEANPYDPEWESYFEKRLDVRMEAT